MALKQIDPGIQIAAMAPGGGRTTVPHIVTFSGITATLAKVYRQPDEALRQSVHNAAMMRRDPMIMGPLLARQQAVALLPWSIVPEDEKDPELKRVASALEDIVRRTPRLTEYFRNLMEAIWYGKQASQHGWGKTRDREGRAIRYIQRWVPLLGDKLVFRFDDGKGEFDPDQIGIKVTPAWARSNVVLGEPDLEYTSEGSAVFLNRWQRTRIAVHKHLVMDGDYIEPWSAGMIHGVGLRHFLYWCWFQKQETLAQLSEVVERTGMGFTIYFYPSGNERAKQEVTEIAEQQPNKNQIIMPFDASNPDAYRIEQIPPNTGGITALSHLVDDYFGNWIIRFILGQTLSMRADATGMGSGLSDLQKDSFLQIVRYDATNLEETLTTDLVQPLLLFNFPKYRNTRFFLKIATESSVPAEKLQAMQMAWSMGAKLRAQDVLDMVGASVAGEDDDTVWNPGVVGAMMQIQQAKEQEKQKQEQAEAQQGQQLPPEYQALLQGGLQPQQQAKRYFKGVDLPAANAQRSIKVTQDKNGWHAFDEATGVGAYLKDDGALHYTHGDPLDVKDEIEHHLMEAIRLASNPCDCEDPDNCDCDEQPTKYAAGEDEADEDEDDIEPDTTVWAEDVKPLHELGYSQVEDLGDAAWMNSEGDLYSGKPTTRTNRHAGGVISKWDHWGVSDAFPEISSLVGNVSIDKDTKAKSVEAGRRKNSVRHYMTQTDSVLINQNPKTKEIMALTSSGFTPGQLSMLAKHLDAGQNVTVGLIDQNDANAKLLLKHQVRTPRELMQAVATHARLLPRQTSPMEGIEIPDPPEGGSSAVSFLQGPEYKPETGKTNMREVYTRAVDANGRRNRPLLLEDENHRDELAESLAHEAIFAMSKDGNAIEWYDKSLQAAIDKLASINTGPDAEAFQALQDKEGDSRIMLKVFMALTSNMTAVAPNLKQAVELYKHWYATRGKNGRGQIKPDFFLQGQARKAFDKHKILLDELLDHFHESPVKGLSPIASMERFLSRKLTNKEIGAMFPNLGSKATFNRYRVMVNGEQIGDIFKTSKEAKEAAKQLEGATVEKFETRERGKLKVSGELMEGLYSMLPGASVFGPKLGSFFNNLNGKFDTTTMDRWLMRTINRHRGIILDHNDEALKKQAVRLQKLLYGTDENGNPAVIYKVGRNKEVKMTDSDMLGKHNEAVKMGMDALQEAGFTNTDLEADLNKAATTGVIDRNGPAAVFSAALHSQYKKDYTDKRQVFLAAKQLDLNMTQLREAPRKGDERANVRKVMERTRQIVKERTGKDVPEANLQALLWYLEKDLVSHSGLKLARQAATDFQMEAEKLYDQETGTTPEQGRLFHYERNGHGSGSAQRYARWDERGGVRGVPSSHSTWLESLVGESGEKLSQVSSKSGQPQRYLSEDSRLTYTKDYDASLWNHESIGEQQQHQSKLTSLSQVPSTLKAVEATHGWQEGTVNADIGGGRFDHFTNELGRRGVTNYIYDPFNRSNEHNHRVASAVANGRAHTATVNNVLNVIKEPEIREHVIRQAANAIKDDGKAYFLMHEGTAADREKGARVTKSREGVTSWQEFRKAHTYIPEIKKHFGSVSRIPGTNVLIATSPVKQGDQPQRNVAPLLAAVPALLGSLGGAGAAAGGAAAAGTAAAGGATAAGTMGAVGSSLGTIGNMASLGGMAMDVGSAAMGGLEKMASGRHYEPPRSVGDMPDQYAHDTDEWRSWAGEAADNVVEDFHPLSEEATPDRIQTGKPIVVKGYHGTPRGKIDQFDPGLRASTTGAASASIGDFHSGSKETAASYKSADSYPETFYSLSPEQAGFAEDHVWRAKREWMDKNEDSPDYRKVGRMGSAAFLKYLHKKDPEHFETVSYGALQHAGHKGPVSLSFRKPALLENYVRMLNPYVHDHQGGRYKDADYYDIIRKAKAAGHDGVLILNTRDRNVDKDNNDPLSKDHIIVSFKPHQVKAASNKRPTNDPRLKYAEEQLPLDFGGDDEPSKAEPIKTEPVEASVPSPESSESSPTDFDVSKLDLQDGPLDDAESDLGTVADDPTLGATTETTKVDDPYVPPPGVSARPKDGPEVKEDQPTIDEPPAEAPVMSEGEQVASDEVGTPMPKAAAPEAPVKKKVEPLEGPVNQPPAAEQREDTTPLSDAGVVEQEQPQEPAAEQVEDWQLDDAEVQETDAEPPADETEPEAEPAADEAEPAAEPPADEAEPTAEEPQAEEPAADAEEGAQEPSAPNPKAFESANNLFGLSEGELGIARDELKAGARPGRVLTKALGSEENYLKLESHLAKRYPKLLTGESGSIENRQVVAELLTGIHPEVDNAVEPAAEPAADQPADDDAPLKMPEEDKGPAKGQPKQVSVDLEERKRGKLEQQYLEGITAGGDATLSLGEGDKAVDYKQIPLDGGDIADMVVAAKERDPSFQLNGRDPSTVFWVNPATKEVKTIDEIRKEHGDELQKHLQVQHDAALAWHNEGQEIAKSFGFSPDKLNFDRKAAARLQDYTLKAAASAGLDLNKYPRDKQPEMARQFLNERREHISGFLQSAAEAGFPGGPSDNLLDGANAASQWLLASAMESGWKPDAAEMKKGGITPKMAVSALQHIQQQKSKEMQGIQGLIKKMGGAKTLVISLMAVAGVMMLLRSMSSQR